MTFNTQLVNHRRDKDPHPGLLDRVQASILAAQNTGPAGPMGPLGPVGPAGPMGPAGVVNLTSVLVDADNGTFVFDFNDNVAEFVTV